QLKTAQMVSVSDYEEVLGKGQQARINGEEIKIGSQSFVGAQDESGMNQTRVYISINGKVKGKFEFQNQYRKGLKEMLLHLDKYEISILSGDNDSEKENLAQLFPGETEIHFN